MPGPLQIRRPLKHEQSVVQALVQTVVDQVYGGVCAPVPVPIGMSDWLASWIAIVGGTVAGVALTQDDCVADLWILEPYRGSGLGQLLLEYAEREIATRGYSVAHLRVVSSNRLAVRFYQQHGWRFGALKPHEQFPVLMLEMTRDLQSTPPPAPCNS